MDGRIAVLVSGTGSERLYEQAAEPLEWKFTRIDLARLMKGLREKEALPTAV